MLVEGAVKTLRPQVPQNGLPHLIAVKFLLSQ